MADTAVDAKEVAAAPEKEVVEKKGEEVAEVEEKKEKKITENGAKNGVSGETKENGASDEEGDEVESTENGGSESAEVQAPTKRKSTGGDADAVPTEGVTPEKKAKLVEPEEEDTSNGAAEAEATA